MKNANTLIIVGVALLAACYLALQMVAGEYQSAYAVMFVMVLLSFSKWLAVGFLGTILFYYSSFQLPLPTSPQVWQLCSLLIPAGLVSGFFMGKAAFPKKGGGVILAMVALPAVLYMSVVLISTVYHGNSAAFLFANQGGRQVLKQLMVLALPLAAMVMTGDNVLPAKIFKVAFLLSASYLISEAFLFFAPSLFPYTTLFLEPSVDLMDYAGAAAAGSSIVRLQAVSVFATNVFALLLIVFPLRKLNEKPLLIIPVGLVIILLVAGILFGGMRKSILFVPFAIAVALFYQRLWTVPKLVAAAGLGLVVLVSLYPAIDYLPGAIQRALSVVPIYKDQMDPAILKDGWDIEQGRELVRDQVSRLSETSGFMGVGLINEGGQDAHGDMVEWAVAAKLYSSGFLGHYVILGLPGLIAAIMLAVGCGIFVHKTLRRLYQVDPNCIELRILIVYFAYRLYYFLFFIRGGEVQGYAAMMALPAAVAVFFYKNSFVPGAMVADAKHKVFHKNQSGAEPKAGASVRTASNARIPGHAVAVQVK